MSVAQKMPTLALLGIALHTAKESGVSPVAALSFFDAVWALFDELEGTDTGKVSATSLESLRAPSKNDAVPSKPIWEPEGGCGTELDILTFAAHFALPEYQSRLPQAAQEIDHCHLRKALQAAGQFCVFEAVEAEPAVKRERPSKEKPTVAAASKKQTRTKEKSKGKRDEDALFDRAMGRSKPLPVDSPLWREPVKRSRDIAPVKWAVDTVEDTFVATSPPSKSRRWAKWLEMPEWPRVARHGHLGVQLRLNTVCYGIKHALKSGPLQAAFVVVPRDFSTITDAVTKTPSNTAVRLATACYTLILHCCRWL